MSGCNKAVVSGGNRAEPFQDCLLPSPMTSKRTQYRARHQLSLNCLGVTRAWWNNLRTGMGCIGVAIGSNKINFLILVLWLALTVAGPARADARPWTLDRYQHSTWTTRDGAPVGVTSLTQTNDGFIWVGSSEGLFRFDGLRFQHIENIGSVALPKLPLMTVFAGADGGLWLGYSHGPIFEIKGDTVAHVSSEEHGPVSTINSQFVDSPQGGIWAAVSPGVMTFDGKEWIIPDAGFQDLLNQKTENVTRVLVDRNGNVWTGTGEKLLYRPAHSTQFMTLAPSEQKGQISDIMQSRDGSVWICYTESGIERWDTRTQIPIRSDAGALSQLRARFLAFDRQGNAWVSTQKNGIAQVPEAYRNDGNGVTSGTLAVGKFDSSNGLSADAAGTLLVDREDNLWVGTSHGIDRFSRSNFARSPFPENGGTYALAAGKDGSVWAGMQLQATVKLKDGHLSTSIPGTVPAIFVDRDGNTYLSRINPDDSFDLWAINDANTKLLVHSKTPWNAMSAIVKDSHGVIWGLSELSNNGRGNLFSLHGDQWAMLEVPKVKRPPSSLYADDSGRVWYGYLRGRNNDDLVGVIDGGKASLLGAEQGVTIGSIGAFMSDGRRLWVGGSEGLGFMDGMRMHAARLSQESLGQITGIVFASNDDMWIHAMSGVYRVPAKDVIRSENDPSHVLPLTKFDGLDGLPGPPDIHWAHPTVVKSTDGRLWFATINGVVWLDPTQLISNPVPPSISITKVLANDVAYGPHDNLTFPALTHNIDIEFSVLSFSIPERVDAKVRLLGVDADWQSIGSRREISYSNLSPGKHQIDIEALNSDGVRSREDTRLVFYIKPVYYQTLWFKALCLLTLLAAVWLAVALRLRHASRRLRISLEAKHKERESIARELHDTLLQGMQGLLMQMEFWARRADLAPQQRDAATAIEEKMRDVLIDGRDKIRLLRQDDKRELDLVSELLTVGQGASAISPSLFSLRVEGEPLPVCQEASIEIFAIAREAILNAYRHADADHVVVTITYEASALKVAVSDDGMGIDKELMEARQRAGHWGISGMHERAEKINAHLQIDASSQGTTIRLTIPKREAYLSHSGANWSRLPWWRQQTPRRHKTDKASA